MECAPCSSTQGHPCQWFPPPIDKCLSQDPTSLQGLGCLLTGDPTHMGALTCLCFREAPLLRETFKGRYLSSLELLLVCKQFFKTRLSSASVEEQERELHNGVC